MSGLDEGLAARLGHLRRYRLGDLLAAEGDAGSSIFLVRSGRVEVVKGSTVLAVGGGRLAILMADVWDRDHPAPEAPGRVVASLRVEGPTSETRLRLERGRC